MAIAIAGTPVPVGALTALPKVIGDIIHQAPPNKTFADLLPAIVTAANFYCPGTGYALEAVIIILGHLPPMTPQQERAWMDRHGMGPH